MPQSIPTPILPGAGGLPKFILAAPDTARAEIYLQGSHITSWIPAGGTEQLFLSRTASFAPGDPIRGGVPVCWPQFSGEGPLQPHGFARNVAWQRVGAQANPDESVTATLRLSDDAATQALWPHSFAAEMAITVGGNRLHMAFAVTNTGDADFTFSGALHTYLRLGDVHNTTVEGFAGLPYKNTFSGQMEAPQIEPLTHFGPEGAGRVCYGAQDVIVREGRRAITLTNENFPDIVLWNPGTERAARIPDLEPDGYRHMLCIEAGVVGTPVRLSPGQSWKGGQIVEVSG
ncbi:MAG: D-hexose-6-phosphate mutarotase [Chloroflexi bacterium]|nr:MAG: D-hexose-6-phosphate mutarotase [Chloroflexota bacterium]